MDSLPIRFCEFSHHFWGSHTARIEWFKLVTNFPRIEHSFVLIFVGLTFHMNILYYRTTIYFFYVYKMLTAFAIDSCQTITQQRSVFKLQNYFFPFSAKVYGLPAYFWVLCPSIKNFSVIRCV